LVKNITNDHLVYYLPGYGGSLSTGLGAGLMQRGLTITGRETRDEFRTLPFSTQVQTIVEDLQAQFWHPDAQVICNSFGAYLFLHAQSQMPPYVGRVLVLSPILGEFNNVETSTGFSPPQPTKLFELAQSGQFHPPASCEIHVGSDDWQSRPEAVREFGRLTGVPVHVVDRRGHDLGADYVGIVLDAWLS
jgi:pimeloyl-ACP methyl ester carboxylesterase